MLKKNLKLISFCFYFLQTFTSQQHLRHSAYSESKVITAAGTQLCQFKSRWERSCHETAAAAKPYPFGLLSQAITQATGAGGCWHVWFPGVGKLHLCCCCCSLTIWQMLVAILSFLSLFTGAELTQICQCSWHCPDPGTTWGTTPMGKGIPFR